MWTAERHRSAELKLQILELKKEESRQEKECRTLIRIIKIQEHRELDAFCSLNLAVIYWCRTSNSFDLGRRKGDKEAVL